MSELQVIRVFTKWDASELSKLKSRLAALQRVKEKDLTNDHIAKAEYLAHAAKYFADKARETSADLSKKRSIQ
jgi:hypothetical protein